MITLEEVRAQLQAQASDLSRFERVVAAQFATLEMESSSLLDQLGREADLLIAEVERRNEELMEWPAKLGEPADLADLRAAVVAAAELAERAVRLLTTRLRSLETDHVQSLADLEIERNRLVFGYATRAVGPTTPVLLDRAG